MPTVTTHDHQMHYLDREGEGPPVRMVHSSGLNARQWIGLRALLSGRRVVIPDLIGYGESSLWQGGDDFDWRIDVEGLEAILDLHEGPWDVVGHSYGGLLAMRVALRNPSRVRRLSMHEPVVWGVLASDGKPEDAQALQDTIDGLFAGDEPLTEAAWMAYFVDFWNGRGVWDSLPDARQAQWVSSAQKVIPEVRAICFDQTAAATWAQIAVPTLITVGNDSPGIERAACQVLASVMPNVRLLNTSGGHMAPITHGREVLEHHRAFVSEP